MRIVVPTYRRHSNGEATTLENIPSCIPLTLAVRREERDDYRRLIQSLGRTQDRIWAIPDGAVRGIATTRQWIVERALVQRELTICMVDDDLHFIQRGLIPRDQDGWQYKLRPCDVQGHLDLFGWMQRTLLLDGYHHCAISMREGNNNTPGIGATLESSRGIRCVAYRLDLFREGQVRFREEVEGREDIDMTLQLLRLGRPNLVSYHYAQGQRTAENPGGLEGTRPAEQLRATAERLSSLHPGLVRLREKRNKSGGMSFLRTEVTLSWKGAIDEGERRLRAERADLAS